MKCSTDGSILTMSRRHGGELAQRALRLTSEATQGIVPIE